MKTTFVAIATLASISFAAFPAKRSQYDVNVILGNEELQKAVMKPLASGNFENSISANWGGSDVDFDGRIRVHFLELQHNEHLGDKEFGCYIKFRDDIRYVSNYNPRLDLDGTPSATISQDVTDGKIACYVDGELDS